VNITFRVRGGTFFNGLLSGADIGWGTGDGLNEAVPYTLEFGVFNSICSASLEIEYSFGDELLVTDHLLFADNISVLLPLEESLLYGNPEFVDQGHPNGGTIRLDLTRLGTNLGRLGEYEFVDVRELLLDGELHVVSLDDHIVHGVRLEITGERGACNPADLAEPFGLLDLADINAFTAGFVAMEPIADLNADGLFDLSDIILFVESFTAGCP